MMRSHHSYISQATDCVHVDIISVNRACPIVDNFREINFTKFFVNLMLMSFCCMKRLYIPFYFRECPRVCPIVVSLPCSALNCPALFSILSTSAENSMNFFSLLLLLQHL